MNEKPNPARREETVAAIKSAIRPTAKLVVVHSRVGAFELSGDSIEHLLSALAGALSPDVTLAMPVFTFDFCQSGKFDAAASKSETGKLTEAFRRQPDVVRTRHPIYSFALNGPLAAELAAEPGYTCWGDDTIFAEMEKRDTDIVLLGCTWESCTLIHRAEQRAAVPYRYTKTFSGTARYEAEPVDVAVEMEVRYLDLPTKNCFQPVRAELQKAGRLRIAELGGGTIEAAAARDVLAACKRLLDDDPLSLLAEPAAYRQAASR